MAPGRNRASPAVEREGCFGRFIVGNADEGETGWPHDPQNRLPGESAAEQCAHATVAAMARA
jgi:hypothetical protein